MKRLVFVIAALCLFSTANAQQKKNTVPVMTYSIKDCMKERFSLEKVARLNKYTPPTAKSTVLYSIDYYDDMSGKIVTIFVQPNIWHKIMGFLDAKAEMNRNEGHPWWQELNSLMVYKLNENFSFIDYSDQPAKK